MHILQLTKRARLVATTLVAVLVVPNVLIGEVAALEVVRPSITEDGITVSPSVEITDGIIRGNLNATSARGAALKYEFVNSSNGGKLDIGTVAADPSGTNPQSFTVLPYATWLCCTAKGTETFRVRVSEVNNPNKSVVATVTVDVAALAPGETPVAFTYKVVSFNGIKISTNFFPASGLAAGETAPVILHSPGFGQPGITNPYKKVGTTRFVPGPAMLRAAGYNEITWDARGTFGSGGFSYLGNPFYEGRDISAIISWSADSTPTLLNGAGDPAVGMIGSDVGGATQLSTVDPRIDGIVPANAWNSLVTNFESGGVFRSGTASRLMRKLESAEVRIGKNLKDGLLDAVQTGALSAATRALLASSGPTTLLNQLQAPTLLIQNIMDPTFPLAESLANAQWLLNNPYGTPVKITWFNPRQSNKVPMFRTLRLNTISWMDQYVDYLGGATNPADAIPNFQWWDQLGNSSFSGSFPFSEGFNLPTPASGSLAEGFISIVAGAGSPVSTVAVPVTLSSYARIAGAPNVTFSYRGEGDATAVYVRVVDKSSDSVIGRTVSAVPVVLDGKSHTVSVQLADIVFSNSSSEAELEFQISSAGTGFKRLHSGTVSLTNITVDVPVKQNSFCRTMHAAC